MASVWYYDPENGSGANGGTGPSDAKATFKEAVALANADGGAAQTIYAMSSATRTPNIETSQVSVTCEELTIIGYDSAGNIATDTDYLWAERPLFHWDHFGQGVVMSHASAVNFYGVEWDGLGKCSNGFSQGVGGARLECYDFIGHDFVGSVVSSGSGGCWLQRFTLHDSAKGVSSIGAGGQMAMVVGTIRDMSAEGIFKVNTTDFAIAYSVLVTGCGGVAGPLSFCHTLAGTASWVLRNCLVVDNPTTHGIVADDWAGQGNNCWSSDPLTYHTTGNWVGVKSATDYEVDPLHTDAAADDYHLDATSPMFGAAVAQPPSEAEDRAVLPNVLGPLGAIPPLVLSLDSTGGTTSRETFPVRGTANQTLDTVAVTFDGGTSSLNISVDGLSFSAPAPLTLTEGRNELEVTAVAQNGTSATAWFAVRYKVAQVPLRENRILHMFPEGMRPR